MFVLTLAGMTDSRCIPFVTAAIRSQDAQARVEVRLEENRVFVETKADLEKVKRALQADGYHVEHSEPRP